MTAAYSVDLMADLMVDMKAWSQVVLMESRWAARLVCMWVEHSVSMMALRWVDCWAAMRADNSDDMTVW